jgi:hypothetical protein
MKQKTVLEELGFIYSKFVDLQEDMRKFREQTSNEIAELEFQWEDTCKKLGYGIVRGESEEEKK